MSFKINTLAALTLALAAFAQPASAAENLDRAQRSVTISYADLNLASATGAKQLYRRIGHAARQLAARSPPASCSPAFRPPCGSTRAAFETPSKMP